MNITGKKIWQVAAGDTNRNYADLCLYWDVVLNGPGDEGAWPDCEKNLREEWKLSSRKITDLRRFAEEIYDGDIIVLRMGTTDILGIGLVVGGYLWNDEFGDIEKASDQMKAILSLDPGNADANEWLNQYSPEK